jgi:hypothetical protein
LRRKSTHTILAYDAGIEQAPERRYGCTAVRHY